jgi:GNAT superfamily N-acetyltransferase
MVATLTDAFHHDPTWSWAFPDPVARPHQYRKWWGLFVDGALRYDVSWLADDGAAVAVWLPPGGSELSDEQAETVEPLLRELVGPHADAVLELFHRFDDAHPNDEPHYYLTLLGTRSDRRGEGLGMALLRHCLDQWDAEGVPSYLESSNPANDRRYQALGYERVGEFRGPGDGPVVASMWRPAGA